MFCIYRTNYNFAEKLIHPMDSRVKDLIESFSKYFETYHNFAPLTSKIYAYLLVENDSGGTSFDTLTEIFNASKSSVSNSLNVLTQLKYIEYYSKIDQRKRLYRIAPNATMIRLEKIHDLLILEKDLSEKFKRYLLDTNDDPQNIQIIKSNIYIEHLDSTVRQLADTIQKLNSLKDKN